MSELKAKEEHAIKAEEEEKARRVSELKAKEELAIKAEEASTCCKWRKGRSWSRSRDERVAPTADSDASIREREKQK